MTSKKDVTSIAGLMKQVLSQLGEDPSREGLERTPERVERALRFLTQGYGKDVEQVVKGSLYTVKYDEMVIVRDIEFFSLCEHHLLPFFGKIPRIVDVFARRLQVQERLTQQVAESLQRITAPLGVGVICEARHIFMMMRGVEKQHSGAVTSAMLGAFRTRRETREEFLSLVAHNSLQF